MQLSLEVVLLSAKFHLADVQLAETVAVWKILTFHFPCFLCAWQEVTDR